MYETIAIINGKEIYRMKGTKGFYHVAIKADRSVTANFRTLKAAKAFCEA